MRTSNNNLNPRLSLAVIAAAALLLSGCGADDNATEQPSPAPTEQQEDTTSPDPAPETDTGAETDDATDDATDNQTGTETADPTGELTADPIGEFSTELQQSDDWPAFGETEGIYPVEIDTAVHDGFERIVIEHAGSGIPSHMAQYTEEPVEPGRGNPIDTGDGAYLEVILSGTASIDDIDEDQMIDNGTETTDLNTQAAGTVVSFAPWEATSNYIIGLDEQRPYAVTVLDDPVRVVVDIQLDDEA